MIDRNGNGTFRSVVVNDGLTVNEIYPSLSDPTGTISIVGNIGMNDLNIKDLADPVSALDAVNKQYVDAFRAVGDIKHSVQSNDHSGWLKCDGRALSTAVYAGLFAVIGTAFGSGGVGTFRIPDCRGRVMGAIGQGAALTDRALGATVGAEAFTMTTNEMPAHTHTGTSAAAGAHSHSITDPGHTHTQTTVNDDFNSSGANPPSFASDSAGERTWNNINGATTGITVNAVGDHTHTFTTNSVGSGNSFSLMQPTLFIGNVFIFANVF